MDPIKVLLADDHAIVRNGIKLLLESESNIEVIGEASNGEEAVRQSDLLNPDILILDIRMPVMNGIEAANTMASKNSHTKVLILSMHDDEEYITKTAESGAYGYVLKDASKEEFIKAINTINDGNKYFSGDISNILVNQYLNFKSKNEVPSPNVTTYDFQLTKREKEILNLLHRGLHNKDIADQLGKSIRTIETHRFNIMKKMGINSVTDLLLKIDQEPGFKQYLEN